MENVNLKNESNNANSPLSAVEFLKWCNTPVNIAFEE